MKRSAILITFAGLAYMVLFMSSIVPATFANMPLPPEMMPVVNEWTPPWLDTWGNEMSKWQPAIQPGWDISPHIPNSDTLFPEPNKDPDLADVQTVPHRGSVGLAEYSPLAGARGGVSDFSPPPSSPNP